MITKENLEKAKAAIIENWGEDGKKVVEVCQSVTPFGGKFAEFLRHCVACGGEWERMFLTGIKSLYPEVYDAIPNEMGENSFILICYVLQLCGVEIRLRDKKGL